MSLKQFVTILATVVISVVITRQFCAAQAELAATTQPVSMGTKAEADRIGDIAELNKDATSVSNTKYRSLFAFSGGRCIGQYRYAAGSMETAGDWYTFTDSQGKGVWISKSNTTIIISDE